MREKFTYTASEMAVYRCLQKAASPEPESKASLSRATIAKRTKLPIRTVRGAIERLVLKKVLKRAKRRPDVTGAPTAYTVLRGPQ